MGPFIRYSRDAIAAIRDAYHANPSRYKFTRDDDRRKARFERPTDQYRKRRDRDVEAFEEGYKYELEQSAKLQQQLAAVTSGLPNVRVVQPPVNDVDAAFQDFDDEAIVASAPMPQGKSRFQFSAGSNPPSGPATQPPSQQAAASRFVSGSSQEDGHAAGKQPHRQEKVFQPPPAELLGRDAPSSQRSFGDSSGSRGGAGGGVPLPRSAAIGPQPTKAQATSGTPAASQQQQQRPARTGFYDSPPQQTATFFDPAIVQATPAAAASSGKVSSSPSIASLLAQSGLRTSSTAVVSGTVDASQLEASILAGAKPSNAGSAAQGWAVTGATDSGRGGGGRGGAAGQQTSNGRGGGNQPGRGGRGGRGR